MKLQESRTLLKLLADIGLSQTHAFDIMQKKIMASFTSNSLSSRVDLTPLFTTLM